MKNKITITLFALLAMVAFAVTGHAQVATYNTTLTAAVNATQGTVPFAAMTNMVASSQTVTSVAYCDGELMKINAINTTSLIANVSRGYGVTQGGNVPYSGTHQSGAICWFGVTSGGPFTTTDPFPGTVCAATNYAFLPLINTATGLIWDCTGSRWEGWRIIQAQASWPRTAVADAAYAAKLSDYIIAYTTITAARTLTLPTPNLGMVGKVYVVKNENAGTSTYTIWVSGTVDGSTNTPVFGTGGYQVKRLYTNGVAWFSF